uniref:Choline transporter-like protein n=1 Tax=Gouania willdenowi TaxID=441366 RepID=A0A8C5H210_GOUWI
MGKKKDEEDSDNKFGEPAQFDPNFRGLIQKRGCTDIICCVLFFAVILGYIVVGILAWLYGDPRHILYPKNSTGSFCGSGENKYARHQNVHMKDFVTSHFAFSSLSETGQTCSTLTFSNVPHVQPNSGLWCIFCSHVFKIKVIDELFQTVRQIVDQELCPFFYIPTTPGRRTFKYCVFLKLSLTFSSRVSIRDIVKGFNAKEIGVRIFEDFATSWPWILIGLLIAMLVSLLFLLLLRFIAPVMVWLLIIGVLGAGAYGIYHCYWEYDKHKKNSATITDLGFTTNFNSYLQVQETWLAFLIILSIVEAILLLMLIFLRNRIRIAIALIQESSKAVGHIMSALLFPLITFALLLVCVAYWGTTALYLATSGNPIYKVVALNSTNGDCKNVNGTVDCDPTVKCPSASCIFIKYNNEGLFQRNLFNLQIYNAVAFLWCVNFVIALGQCTLAGAFASYYWAFNKPADIPYFPVCGAFIRSLRYHVGSLAFGALILTLVQIIRIILEYIDSKLNSAENGLARCIMCCLKCCFWCLEKFVKFINRNAYIMVAIYGKNFCVSAKNAFSLLMRNVLRVVVLDKVTDLLLFFGKLLVVGGVGVLSFFFFSGRIRIDQSTFHSENLNYYWMPIITVVFGSYLIAHGFFSVYNMCVDTLFLCFLEDLERNDGSEQKPYFMSKNLMNILNKSNKTPKTGSKKK